MVVAWLAVGCCTVFLWSVVAAVDVAASGRSEVLGSDVVVELVVELFGIAVAGKGVVTKVVV